MNVLGAAVVDAVVIIIVTVLGGPAWAAFGFGYLTYLVLVGRK